MPGIEDLPTIETAGRRGRQPDPDSPVVRAFSQRRAQTAAGSLIGSIGTTLGFDFADLVSRGVAPTGQQLAALQANPQALHSAGPGYTMFLDCGGHNYNGTCNEACFGFAPHHMDPWYCATCDEQAADPVHNPSYNWHFVGSRGSLTYMDREPDVCGASFSDRRDAWKWKVGACGECEESAEFRCHDGWKQYSDGTTDPTICQGLVACDGKLTPCP